MKQINLKFLPVFLLVLIFSLQLGLSLESGLINNENELNITFFHMYGCSACAQMKPFLEGLENEYNLNLSSYEISNKENSNLFYKYLDDYDVPKDKQGYVPVVFIKDKYFVGYNSQITQSIEEIVVKGETNLNSSFGGDVVKSEILGFWDVEVSLKNKSLITTTLLLGFLDSLNVCSITVLVFLIVYTLSIGSLKRAFKLGLIFTSIIFLFYFLFMFALTTLISSLMNQYGIYIRIILIILSLFASVLLIKDYFFYGKGLSLRIPKSAKPLLEKYLKKATIASTIIFALLASLVELPCTAVFPLIYSTILAENMVFGASRLIWIALYNLIYILPLLLIVIGTYFSWTKINNIDEKIQKYKKVMKLIAGIGLLLISFYFAYPLIV